SCQEATLRSFPDSLPRAGKSRRLQVRSGAEGARPEGRGYETPNNGKTKSLHYVLKWLYLCCISPHIHSNVQSVTFQESSRGVKIKITRVNPDASDIPLPAYATPGSSGMDLQADIRTPLAIGPSQSALIPTGFSIELPPGYEAQIRPRSGLAARQ